MEFKTIFGAKLIITLIEFQEDPELLTLMINEKGFIMKRKDLENIVEYFNFNIECNKK